MARLAANSPVKLSGKIGKELLFKNYGNKVVVTRYPDMSRVKPSGIQKHYRNAFKEAVAYAKNINRTPALKQQYLKKIKKGESVYHYAIKEYLNKQR
jgi:hypothetical protein